MAETIKVAVRVRPLLQREIDAGANIAVTVHNAAVSVVHANQHRTFGFDHAYWSVSSKDVHFASQDQVNSDIGKPCLENMLKGYNFCVFAYGQTGAGKTHTLNSTAKDKQMGLIPYVLEGLFYQHRMKFKNDELRVWISFMEIYNEQIRDLLSPGREVPDLKVRDHPELGAYVPGLTEAPCSEMHDVKSLLDFGTKKRVTAATNMNAGSSRSHAVFTIRAQRLAGHKPAAPKKDDRKSLSSRVNLVDLAGSERIARSGADGLRLREGCAINQSLTALGLVIKQLGEIQRDGRRSSKAKLDERTKAIPFRASKLTFLLRESLAGNSRTFMVGAISPASTSADETVSTLRFASSVKRIKTVALQNVNKKEEIVTSLQAEVARLAEMLQNVGEQGGAGDAVMVSELHDDLAERERLLSEMTKSRAQQIAEAKQLQAKREEVLKEMGVTQQDLAQTVGIDKDVPYLLNMNEDPALSGKMMYFLPPGQPIKIGAHADNKIVLQGLGVPDYLCEIENLGEQGVVVRTCQQPHTSRLSMKARVCVNGSAMTGDEQRKLKHNDKLFLGRVSAVRLIVPEAARSLGQAGSVLPEREQDAELLRAVIPEDSRAWAELHLYLEDLRSRLGEECGQEIFQTLIEASNLVDEANEITAAVRPSDCLKFEVELVWDIHRAAKDIVVIRLMKSKDRGEDRNDEETRSQGSQGSDPEDAAVLAYWTLLKFKARLDQMRDCFDEHQKQGKWEGSGDCLRDPWMETSIEELRQRLVAHIDVESKRRSASKTVAPLSPRGRNQTGSQTLVAPALPIPATVRFGSKTSMISAESLSGGSGPASVEGSKTLPAATASVRPKAGTLGRRMVPKGIEAMAPVPSNAPSTSSSLKLKPQDDPAPAAEKPISPRGKVPGEGASQAPGSTAVVKQKASSPRDTRSADGNKLKEELHESMKAQLREKTEKEELYRSRIEYLQQQIDVYNQYAARATVRLSSPRMAPASPRDARARSLSPSCEPRTPDADVTGLSTTRTAASFIGVRSGTATIRSLSAQEVRTNEPARQFSPEREAASPRVPGSPTPIVCVSREPVVLTSPPGSCTAPTPAKRASPQREPTISPRPLVPPNVIPRLESLRSVSIPATTMYSVSAVRSVQPLYVPAGPQYVVLPQGRAKEPLAVIPGNSNNVPLRIS